MLITHEYQTMLIILEYQTMLIILEYQTTQIRHKYQTMLIILEYQTMMIRHEYQTMLITHEYQTYWRHAYQIILISDNADIKTRNVLFLRRLPPPLLQPLKKYSCDQDNRLTYKRNQSFVSVYSFWFWLLFAILKMII